MGFMTRLKIATIMLLAVVAGLFVRNMHGEDFRPPTERPPKVIRLTTTAYCPCGSCCGWRRNWLGAPVIDSGPNRGRRKEVGITASGTRARPGTIAADTKLFPFGTVMYIPGYGYGRVEDIGGDIKGYHIDLYYHRHGAARSWGRQVKEVKVWLAPVHHRQR